MASKGRSRHQASIKPREDRRFLGIGMVLLAYLTFTGIDTSAKWLVINGMPSLQVVFSRYAVQLVLVLAWILPTYGLAAFKSNALGLEITRAVMLLLATIFNFFAIAYLPLTVTASILFTMPLILCALSIPLLGETVGWRRWVAILVGFIGVLVIIQPGGSGFHWAMLLSLVSVSVYALYNIISRKLAGVDPTHTQQLYSALVATVCIVPFAFLEWMWPRDPVEWTAFLIMGALAAFGHLLLTVAHRMAEASVLAPFVYPHIIYMTAASWLVFGQAPDIWIFVGAPIVIGSGLYIWLREKQLSVKPPDARIS